MEFEFTEEQLALREVVRSFASRSLTDMEVREHLNSEAGFDRSVWIALGTELGVLGLALPASFGGDDSGVVSLAIVAEELGRVLAGVPLLGSVALAGTALAQSGGAVAAEVLPHIISGERVVSLVATNARGEWKPEDPDVTAIESSSGVQLHGTASVVLDAPTADAFVVVARADAGPSLYFVDAIEEVTVEPLTALDQTRRLGRVSFSGSSARLLVSAGRTAEVVDAARDVGAVVLASEAVGGMSRLLQLSVRYAADRIQFGRPIGSFQGVKHRCADMHIAAEEARSTAYHAAWSLDTRGLDEPMIAVNLARERTAGGYPAVAKNALQVHGGIGFTWEHPIHLYYKRAVSDASLLGGRVAAADRLAGTVLDAVS